MGAGDYTFRASGCFYVVDAMGNIEPISADPGHHIAKIAVKLARPTTEKTVLEERAKFIGCSSSQESEITSAISITTRYVQNAFECVMLLVLQRRGLLFLYCSYLQEHASGTARYIAWFGDYTDQRHGTVLSHFEHIHENDFSSFTYDCTCSDADVFAFVYPDQSVMRSRVHVEVC
jgi:peptidyl-Lys metalloendopeptidase